MCIHISVAISSCFVVLQIVPSFYISVQSLRVRRAKFLQPPYVHIIFEVGYLHFAGYRVWSQTLDEIIIRFLRLPGKADNSYHYEFRNAHLLQFIWRQVRIFYHIMEQCNYFSGIGITRHRDSGQMSEIRFASFVFLVAMCPRCDVKSFCVFTFHGTVEVLKIEVIELGAPR